MKTSAPKADRSRGALLPRRAAIRAACRLAPSADDWRAVRRHPTRDLLAGVTVAIVALPLALAFGVTSGLGAQAGLITAVIAGATAAVFGGSNLQVSGPTGAMTVVLVPIVHQYGPGGVMFAGLLAGGVLIAAAAAGLGGYVRHLPLPVVEGFTAGIAIVIALQQVPAILGTEGDGEQVLAVAGSAAGEWLASPQFAAPLIALTVAAAILIGARLRPGVPFSLLAIVGAAITAHVAHLPVRTLGALPSGLPAPSLSFVDPALLGQLLPAALAIAALAALESLLSATVADGMAVNERHDPDRELFGQGLANVVSPMFGGMPATAAIARTAVNVRAGASSKLAALTHAVVLAVIVAVATELVADIPLAALAGVLLATTVRMVDKATMHAILHSTRGDAAVLLLTVAVTVTVDLVTAVGVGVVLAMVLALREIARSARFEQTPVLHEDHADEERRLLADRIVAFRPEGALFFGAASRFLTDLTDVTHVEVVILRMSRIHAMDTTGAHVLADATEQLRRRGITVLFSGVDPTQRAMMELVGIAGQEAVFERTPDAIAHARQLLTDRGRATSAGAQRPSGPDHDASAGAAAELSAPRS